MTWPSLETDRLVLRPLLPDDFDVLAELHAEESFWWFPFKRGRSADETRSFLDDKLQTYENGGLAVWAVVVRDSQRLAGWAGLSIPDFLPEILPSVEVGWRLGKDFRGHGYATEAGQAWLQYAFDQLGLDALVSIYEPDNIASGSVMRRLGFTLDRETAHPTRHVALHVMTLSRKQWAAAPNSDRRRQSDVRDQAL